jgi:glycosyltransferase involved in cell wall biosynthesis
MRVLLVVPALNEEAALSTLIEEVRVSVAEQHLSAEILVIDDGSTDHTSQVAYSAGARVVRLCRNLGIGAAVQTGLRIALREGFDCAIQLDGDGQHPPGEIGKLLERAAQAPPPDLVIGTRFVTHEGFRSTPLRRLGSWWLRWLLRVVTRLKVTDPTSGFRYYGRRSLVLFDQTFPYDYPEPEALAIAKAAGLRVAEAPVRMRERRAGRSTIFGLRAPYYMLKVTLALVLSYLRNRDIRLGDLQNESV